MKRIPGSLWLQLFLGLLAGVIGVIGSSALAIFFYIKYAGFELFFGLGSGGDKSPVTLALAVLFLLLAVTFPTVVWFFINRFGNLKPLARQARMITFILFAALPVWTYVGGQIFLKAQNAYEDNRAVANTCIVKDGLNRQTTGESTQEFECRNGVRNGFIRTYKQGSLIAEGTYVDGKLNGTETSYYDNGNISRISTYRNGVQEGLEVFYNEDGSLSLYVIDTQGKTQWVYYQMPEKDFDGDMDLKTQNYFCENQAKPSFLYYSYTCSNNVINGELRQHDPGGELVVRETFANGVLDGVYERFSAGKPFIHLEFRNGKLDGKVRGYNPEGLLNYEGQYTNGLQNGIFRRYDYEGNLESEVVFEDGQLVKINTLTAPSPP